MKRPLDYQIAIAEAEGNPSEVAASFDIDRASVLNLRKLVAEYRRWEKLLTAEARLPLAKRRIEFMPLSRRARNALRRAGLETGGDLLGMTPEAILSIRNAGVGVRREVQLYLEESGEGSRRDDRRPTEEDMPPHGSEISSTR